MTDIEQDSWAARKRRLSLPGGSVAFVEVAGSAPALILLHGFTDTSRSYSLIAPYLAGRRLLIPDLRGHGDSRGAQPAGLADFAFDIIALIDALDLRQPVLVGHSLGTMVAMEMCLRRFGMVSGLVLIAGSLCPAIEADHPLAAGVAALQDPILPTDPFYIYWHHCRPEVPRHFLRKAAEEASLMPADRWRSTLDLIRGIDLRDRAGALAAIPGLIVNGADDPLFGSEHRVALKTALSSADVVDMEGCGHNPHWEKPGRVAEIIANFRPPAAVGG